MDSCFTVQVIFLFHECENLCGIVTGVLYVSFGYQSWYGQVDGLVLK